MLLRRDAGEGGGARALPDRFVVIVTYGRSGSTLLQNLLNAIPGWQIRGENNNALLYLARAWQAVAGSEVMGGLRHAGAVTDPAHPWYGAERVDPQILGRALAETAIRTVLTPDPGIRVAGFKEIRFHAEPDNFWTYLDFIAGCFPDARFVFNTRNLADVARSGWWAREDPARVMQVLGRAEELFADYRLRHPGRCHHVCYDAYVADPGALRPLFDFLGEGWDRRMVARVMNRRLDHLHSAA